jgi:hypothetical protein
VKDGVDMNVEGAAPGIRLHFEQASRDGAAGAMDQDVHTPERLSGSGDARSRHRWVRDIAKHILTRLARSLDLSTDPDGGFQVPAMDNQIHTSPGERERGGSSDAAGAASDEPDFRAKVHDC